MEDVLGFDEFDNVVDFPTYAQDNTPQKNFSGYAVIKLELQPRYTKLLIN